MAFFRPVNPHIRPCTESELLIWDSAYQGKFGADQKIYVGDLDGIHRRLIGLVSDKNKGKNVSTPLTKVWVGWDHPDTTYAHPLDVTLHFLMTVVDNVKYYIPASTPQMLARGWKLVGPDEQRPGESMDVDMDAEERGDSESAASEDTKMVYMPPKGRQNLGPGGKSTCTNTLHVRSQVAMKKGDRDSMIYKFTNTKSWYGKQVAEGRDFKHIMVESWSKVFQQLQIPVSGKPKS